MALDLPPKDAQKDEVKAEAKPKPTSTAALAARLAVVEKRLDHLCDAHYGTNVRPELPEDDNEENGE